MTCTAILAVSGLLKGLLSMANAVWGLNHPSNGQTLLGQQ